MITGSNNKYLWSRGGGDAHKGNRVSTRKSSVLARLKHRAAWEREKKPEEDEKKQAELHLYSVTLTSLLYVHLQRSWNSYIMVRDAAAFVVFRVDLITTLSVSFQIFVSGCLHTDGSPSSVLQLFIKHLRCVFMYILIKLDLLPLKYT